MNPVLVNHGEFERAPAQAVESPFGMVQEEAASIGTINEPPKDVAGHGDAVPMTVDQPAERGEEPLVQRLFNAGHSVWGCLLNYQDGHILDNSWLKNDVIDAALHTIVSVSTNYIALSPF